MRDHFDPLAPLLHQNHHQQSPCHDSMQGQFHNSKVSRPLTYNALGNSPSNMTSFATVAHTDGITGSVGEKRNSDENMDCNLLQSSLKRVRLSRSPGEFRLQRDLKTLDTMQWGSTHVAANALNFSATTWIHRSTGARLTMVDSLRICLFLPITAIQQNGPFSAVVDPQQQYQHQFHSYHRDYRWRIMIQIPRMYPHSPPIVTRVEGLSLDGIVIDEIPPDSNRSVDSKTKNETSGSSSVRSTSEVTSSESLFFTEAQLARSQSSRTMASGKAQSTPLSMVGGSGKTIEWKQWSPITSLGELLDFLLRVAESNLSTGAMKATSTMLGTTSGSGPSMAVTTARMSSSSSSSLSSVSSNSSFSSWGNRNNNESGNVRSSLLRGGSNSVTETIMSDEITTMNTIQTSVSGASFLSPNRFDVGYGKSGAGHRFTGMPGTTPRTANTTMSTTGLSRHQEQQNLQYREKQLDDDVGMDMS